MLMRSLFFAGCATALLATSVWAAPKTMNVILSGAEEIPAVQSPGKGTALLTYDPETMKLSWSVDYSALSGPATMAHFHGPAMAGQNGPVALWLVKKGDPLASPLKGEAVLTAEQAKDFSSGAWYINVHTAANPAGEIRGVIPAAK